VTGSSLLAERGLRDKVTMSVGKEKAQYRDEVRAWGVFHESQHESSDGRLECECAGQLLSTTEYCARANDDDPEGGDVSWGGQ